MHVTLTKQHNETHAMKIKLKNTRMQWQNSTIAYLNVITEVVDIIIKHLFLTVITPHDYEVLSRSKGVNRYSLSAFVRPVYRIKSFGRPKLFVLHYWRGVSARENRGLETAGSGSRYGKRNL